VNSKDAKRIILSFKAMSKMTINGEEFLHFRIKGQSFMLHQIRKIMCMVFQIAREGLVGSESARQVIFGSFGAPHLNIMKAPAQGLFLKEVHFDVYNKHWGTGEGREPVQLSEANTPIVEAFAQEHIWPLIAQEAEEFKSFLSETEEYPMDFKEIMVTADQLEEEKKAKGSLSKHRENYITNFEQVEKKY
jgi:tRNA pseudouridine38-40 synthase